MVVEWTRDWMVGAPMMLATVAFHVSGLCGLEWGLRWYERDRIGRDHTFRRFLFLMLVTTDVALSLHVIEGFVWAALYVYLGAAPDFGSAVLYSLNALTSYGHERLDLANNWQLLGPIQSMSGIVTFGLTTAFIFGALVLLRPQRQNWNRG
jgi:hypothetical protein